jgi:ElaA protein
VTPHFICKPFDQLTTQELYAILRVRQEVFAVEQNIVYQDCDNKDQHCLHLWAYNDKQDIVAYARLVEPGISYEGYCSIGRVLTTLDSRGENYGKQLMQQAITLCKQHYGGGIKISAQQYLEKFYQGLGFTTYTEPYIEEDIMHIGMVLK